MAMDGLSRRGFLAGAAAAALGAPSAASAETFGYFEGDFIGRFTRGGVAILAAPLTFVDPSEERWTAPAGAEVNGASIPRPLWSIVGAPLSGDYLRSAIVHDHYCTSMERDWRATHRAFYYGCRADGLSSSFATLLYAGVMRFGPRWTLVRGLSGGGGVRRREPRFDQQEFDALRDWIEQESRSPDEIDARLQG